MRANALLGLTRCGDTTWVEGHLADPAPAVRAMARETARRNGFDAHAWYRRRVTEDTAAATPALLLGLAECGATADHALALPFLRDPRPRVRASAIAAMRELRTADAAELVPLLDDPSPAVIRQLSRST